MEVPFVKAVACGNDFLIVDAKFAPEGDDINSLSRRMCARHTGIGADGVEWVTDGDGSQADVLARLINSDGSEAELSGNGTRCVAAWWAQQRGARQVRVRTGAGIKACSLVGREGAAFIFESDMGAAEVQGEKSLGLRWGPVTGAEVSLGNPHFVIFCDHFDLDWRSLAQEIQAGAHFPCGVNVEFVRLLSDREVEVRLFERGAGETQSSGTGSCASAIASIHAGRARSPLLVRSPGGAQQVRWEGGQVILRGPAELVCSGSFFV